MIAFKVRSRFLIQWDNRSMRWPFRVVTLAGDCLAYFRSMADAVAYCEGGAA